MKNKTSKKTSSLISKFHRLEDDFDEFLIEASILVGRKEINESEISELTNAIQHFLDSVPDVQADVILEDFYDSMDFDDFN